MDVMTSNELHHLSKEDANTAGQDDSSLCLLAGLDARAAAVVMRTVSMALELEALGSTCYSLCLQSGRCSGQSC